MISILTISLFSIVIGFNIRNKNTKKSINNYLKDFTQKRNLEKSEIIIQTIIVNDWDFFYWNDANYIWYKYNKIWLWI